MRDMKKATLLILSMLLVAFANAQVTSSISGIINNTATVLNTLNVPGNSANVASTVGFAVGDTVLIIQMQGATEDISNTASFGDITNLNNAGKYEFNVICDVDVPGSNLVFQNQLLNTYDGGGGVQVIRVPTYDNVIVTATLTANPWNGSTGGVLVFIARGWTRFSLSQSVMMDSRGFRGGAHQIITDPCGCTFGGDASHTEYFYSDNNFRGAPKGEGIAPFTAGRESGRGKHTTGGGGGNDHNGGGAGGANFGAGGNGGSPCATRSCIFGQYCRGNWPGIGSEAVGPVINNTENRIFLGGGGGAGDDNGGAGGGGTAGGGIVIIVADSINGNGGNIYSRGTQAITGAGDGTGGGGAGGSVLLSTRAYHPSSPLAVYVNGGNGGNSSWSDVTRDHNSKGKGGGGGGGVFWSSGAAIPGNILPTVNGGAAGSELAPTACQGQTGGATAGQAGAVLTNLVLPFSTVPFGVCVLPVEYGYVKAEPIGNMVRLDWETLSEQNSSHFEIQRSSDGTAFEGIGQVASLQTGGVYSFIDPQPGSGVNFYRIKQVDLNGSFQYSKVMSVVIGSGEVALAAMFPNPVERSQDLNLRIALPEGESGNLSILDAFGKLVFQQNLAPADNLVEVQVPTAKLSGGVYFVKITSGNRSQALRRLVVVE